MATAKLIQGSGYAHIHLLVSKRMFNNYAKWLSKGKRFINVDKKDKKNILSIMVNGHAVIPDSKEARQYLTQRGAVFMVVKDFNIGGIFRTRTK